MKDTKKYGFSGGGNMGEALIKGLLKSGRAEPQDIWVCDPDRGRLESLAENFHIMTVLDNQSLVRNADVIILAVKPQVIDQVLSEMAKVISKEHLLISIAAGVPISRIQAAIGGSVPVIRVMPNTPALVLAGASALARGDGVEKGHMVTALDLFEAVGLAVEVEEKDMNTITALSGSGPAYVFVLLEAMIEGAVHLGLPRKQAAMLASQTILGAAKLAIESGRHTAELKDMVTSPGGTTAAGLFALEKGAFRATIIEAIAAATRRGGELGGK